MEDEKLEISRTDRCTRMPEVGMVHISQNIDGLRGWEGAPVYETCGAEFRIPLVGGTVTGLCITGVGRRVYRTGENKPDYKPAAFDSTGVRMHDVGFRFFWELK